MGYYGIHHRELEPTATDLLHQVDIFQRANAVRFAVVKAFFHQVGCARNFFPGRLRQRHSGKNFGSVTRVGEWYIAIHRVLRIAEIPATFGLCDEAGHPGVRWRQNSCHVTKLGQVSGQAREVEHVRVQVVWKEEKFGAKSRHDHHINVLHHKYDDEEFL